MSSRDNLIIKICGSAGDGAISATEILNRAVSDLGYHIMNFDSYPAEIRGFGKSCGHTCISRTRPLTPGTYMDCLVALHDGHAITELDSLAEHGIVIYDSKPPDYHEEDQAIAGYIEPGMIGYGIPLRELSTQAVKSSRSRNIVALGVIAGLFELELSAFETALQKRFRAKPSDVTESNIRALRFGYEYARDHLLELIRQPQTLGPAVDEPNSVILSGNEAVARGAIAAGVRLYSGYPITPATKIMEILARDLPKYQGVVVQTEDEISAACHAIGAGFAGRRAFTATSGPGLCLMIESINLAVMAEIPVVIVDSQRGGPSTGLPTKTEQSDLNLAVYGGSGDSPRPVIAPLDVEECFLLTQKAFATAETYQTPVILLLDFFLSNRLEDVPAAAISVDAPAVPTNERQSETEQYHRFKLTPSGISPRVIPGSPQGFHAVTGLEHDESGRPDYSGSNHQRMTWKRYQKMQTLLEEWPEPEPVGDTGSVEIGFISWGSTSGAVMQAVSVLQQQGLTVAGLFPRLIWPVHQDAIRSFCRRCRTVWIVEMNHGGQYANLIAPYLPDTVKRLCRVYSRPFPPEDIVAKVLQGENR